MTVEGRDGARQLWSALRDDPASERVKGYELLGVIGQGGSGIVYRGRFGEALDVAIKLIDVGDDDCAARERAWREIEFLRQPRLACIPRLVDFFMHEHRLAIVTEFVDGERLDRYCDRHDLGRLERVGMIRQVCEAVECLHERGILHRDLKPSNILVEQGGRPRLIDLGIATLIDRQQSTISETGRFVGTPRFMAPEQARGDHAAVSTRTDVYGIGATGYVLLTGQPPYDPMLSIPELLRTISERPARRARSLDPSLPQSLAAILELATESDRGRRYASVRHLAEDLRRWEVGEPVLARGTTLRSRVARALTRHPVVSTFVLCAVMVLATLAGTTGGIFLATNAPGSAVISQDGRVARLLSIAGAPMRQWNTRVPDGIQAFELFDTDFGPRVLVAFTAESELDKGELQLLDARSPTRPLARVGWLDMPPAPLTAVPPARAYQITTDSLFADVFPDNPGIEFIAAHTLIPSSQCAIRVYGFGADGTALELLFEVWHDGMIKSVWWLEEPRVLLATGYCSEGDLGARGYDVAESMASETARVVFAIEPQRGINREWVGTPGGLGTFECQWYKALEPVSGIIEANSQVIFESPDSFGQPSSQVRVTLNHDDDLLLNCAIIVDARGNKLDVSNFEDRLDGEPVRLIELRPIQ